MLSNRALKNKQIFFYKNFILVGMFFGLVSNSYASFENSFYAPNISKRRVYNSLQAGVCQLQIGENVGLENPLAEVFRKHNEEIGRYTVEARELLATVATIFPILPLIKRKAMAKEMLRQRVRRELREEKKEKQKRARQEAKAQGFEGEEGYRRWLKKQKKIFTFKEECDPVLFLADNKIRKKKAKQAAADNRHEVLWQETIGRMQAVCLQNPPAGAFEVEDKESKRVFVSVDLNLPGSQKLLYLKNRPARWKSQVKKKVRRNSAKPAIEKLTAHQPQATNQLIKQHSVAVKPATRQLSKCEVVVKPAVEQSAKLVTKQSARHKPHVIRQVTRQQSVAFEQVVKPVNLSGAVELPARCRKSQPITRRLAKSERESIVMNLARDAFGVTEEVVDRDDQLASLLVRLSL